MCTSIELPCREGTTKHGRHIWECDVAQTRAAVRSTRLRRRLLGVVEERQAPDEGSPASPSSSTPHDRRACADTWLSSATDARRHLLDSADSRAVQGHHLAPPPTSSPACRSCIGGGVRGRWHSACKQSTGEPGGIGGEADAALVARERQEDHPSVAVCAGEGGVRRRTHRV